MQLTPKFEQQTGNKVVFIYDVLTALREKLAAGEKADVLVMPVPMLDGYAKDGKLGDSSRATFGIVGTSVVVKEGAPKPDISTKEKSATPCWPHGRWSMRLPERRRAAHTWAK